MKNKKLIGYLISVIIIVGLWSIIAIKSTLFPHLLQILSNISTILVDNLIISSIFVTIFRAFIAFLISLIIGIFTANLAYKFEIINYIIQPIITILRSIPTISVILIVIMLVKIEIITYIIVLIITYPICHQTVIYSLSNIDKELLMINKMDNTNSFKNYFYFYLPMSFSGIINAILQTFGLSIKIQIMSELLIGSTKIKGIGILMNYYKNNLELSNLFAITFIVIFIVYIIEFVLKTILKRIQNLT